MNDTPVQLHNTHTQVYRRTDGQEAIQFATRTGGGWLTTSGLLADRLALAKQHRNQLLGTQRLTPRLPDLPPPPDIAPGPAAEVDFDDGPALEGWLQGPNKVGHRRREDRGAGLSFMASFEAFQSHLLRLSWVSGNTPEEGQVGDLYRQLHGAIYGESSHGRDG